MLQAEPLSIELLGHLMPIRVSGNFGNQPMQKAPGLWRLMDSTNLSQFPTESNFLDALQAIIDQVQSGKRACPRLDWRALTSGGSHSSGLSLANDSRNNATQARAFRADAFSLVGSCANLSTVPIFQHIQLKRVVPRAVV